MQQYKKIMQDSEKTVVADVLELQLPKRETKYQTEADLEKEFIQLLINQGYEYKEIKNNDDLKANFRKCIEKLNDYQFKSEKEWRNFYDQVINSKAGVEEKTQMIQKDRVFSVDLDNGEKKNIWILDTKHIHKNHLQVIHQYQANAVNVKNRYDVTILVNGLPLVHLELKRRGVSIKEAFGQIQRYQKESFDSEDGFFDFIQIFVISNGFETKYYSNTTRKLAIKGSNHRKAKDNETVRKDIKSFEYTSYWTDEKNNKISDLMAFGRSFFSKITILNLLVKYCVFDENKILLVMRPYQITAVEKIIQKIKTSTFEGTQGTNRAGGYIWHTTGSGKTLTSFKTAERVKEELTDIKKVVFVVDRRDLDYQTIREYQRFDGEFATGVNKSNDLKQLLESDKNAVIVVTIQKLTNFVKNNSNSIAYKENVVFIFDECHRSQFGKMHKIITNKFKKYHLFGFTGTPIFENNSTFKDLKKNLITTDTLFGDRLHTYTIVNAIDDGTVLPFKIDYVKTVVAKNENEIESKLVREIDTKAVRLAPKRISKIVGYILNHFDQKTMSGENDKAYEFNVVTNTEQIAKNRKSKVVKQLERIKGFNSIFAVESIEFARKYYLEFRKQLQEANNEKFKIATIFTYDPNQENDGTFGSIDDEDFSHFQTLSANDKEFLSEAINDYNKQFASSFNIDSQEGFMNYYKDVSLRMKNKQIDLLIVVNMFLTGFDSTTLNTLWLDKNLRQHGLIQAFSRTNRILNSIKTFGNIVTFRNIAAETEEAIRLFGDESNKNIILLKDYKDYIDGYHDPNKDEIVKGYRELTDKLKKDFPLSNDHQSKIELLHLVSSSDQSKKEFVQTFNEILKMRNVLKTFDEFSKEANTFLDERLIQDYESLYLGIEQEARKNREAQKESILDEVEFVVELIKQDEINIDYILAVISKDIELKRKIDDQIKNDIASKVEASPTLRNKKELILKFIDKISLLKDVDQLDLEEILDQINNKWGDHAKTEYEKELNIAIEELNLKKYETEEYMKDSFLNGEMKYEGPGLGRVIQSTGWLQVNDSAKENRWHKKEKAYLRLSEIFRKYYGLVDGE
ncbi:type I restriction endonuclease subunit R [Mycoplasmopsis gallinacea]|uniref:Type I restriction enzyme endonuclease subunit n=1 Tax=Mycoplasmopsis gallinacea TaxID=29556 RepID=A0A449A258_9BACT|nr:type I restriction endonuclease subunit R [Mycoplasmopsis gallinacea]VEU58309.1 Type I restriction enzyme EcoR124II R protein [Mycoplasmopsis gallinacea]